jgi:hypothetical protein
MRNSSFSVTDSRFQALPFNRQKARRSARLFFLGQCAGSLLLLFVLTAGALAIMATISVLASTRELIGNANSDSQQSVELRNSGNLRQSSPKQ